MVYLYSESIMEMVRIWDAKIKKVGVIMGPLQAWIIDKLYIQKYLVEVRKESIRKDILENYCIAVCIRLGTWALLDMEDSEMRYLLLVLCFVRLDIMRGTNTLY